MVGSVSWGRDTLVEGVEHVEGSGKYRELCAYPIRCLTVRNLCREHSGWGYSKKPSIVPLNFFKLPVFP